jgi:hypothetical protein
VVFEAGSPEEAVRGVVRRRDRDDYDQAWVVCDVDQYRTGEAADLAASADVQLLWSNPCFEVWLLLHKTECSGYIEDARRAAERLCGHVKDWDKADLRFEDFRDGVQEAVRRAKSLGDPPEANPSTAMWRLVEALTAES